MHCYKECALSPWLFIASATFLWERQSPNSMVQFSPFRPYRPHVTHVAEVSSATFEKPDQADYPRVKPTHGYSFWQVLNPGYFTDRELTAKEWYQQARTHLQRLIDRDCITKESEPAFYVYQQRCSGINYTGIIGTVSNDDYKANNIRTHELTKPGKVKAISKFFYEVGINGSPVLLTYPDSHDLEDFLYRIMQNPELYNFTSKDGIQHAVWRVTKSEDIASLKNHFEEIPALYIADGHHRCAASARLSGETGDQEVQSFMACCLPGKSLNIYGYHRLLKHLNGYEVSEILEKAEEKFEVAPIHEKRFPEKSGEIVCWADGQCWGLYPKEETVATDSYKEKLDVYLLHKHLIDPFLVSGNHREENIVYVEGTIRSDRLAVKMQEEGYGAVFLLHPISVNFLMDLSDNGETLPPKSTWIEPKMRSGIFIQHVK